MLMEQPMHEMVHYQLLVQGYMIQITHLQQQVEQLHLQVLEFLRCDNTVTDFGTLSTGAENSRI